MFLINFYLQNKDYFDQQFDETTIKNIMIQMIENIRPQSLRDRLQRGTYFSNRKPGKSLLRNMSLHSQ
jgi:hypothetical protein